MQKDIEKFTSLLKSFTHGDEELEKYIWLIIGATILEQDLSPMKGLDFSRTFAKDIKNYSFDRYDEIANALMSDVRKKYG